MAELKYEIFILPEDRNPENARPFDSLTEEEMQAWRKRVSERLERTMSDYYSNHMDEYVKLKSLPITN